MCKTQPLNTINHGRRWTEPAGGGNYLAARDVSRMKHDNSLSFSADESYDQFLGETENKAETRFLH